MDGFGVKYKAQILSLGPAEGQTPPALVEELPVGLRLLVARPGRRQVGLHLSSSATEGWAGSGGGGKGKVLMGHSLTHIQAGEEEERGIPPGLCPNRKGGSFLCALATRSESLGARGTREWAWAPCQPPLAKAGDAFGVGCGRR